MTHHYYITGVDGIGKTTQVDLLTKRLTTKRVHRVWIRFPALVSLPLLVYARLRGFTRYETTDGVRVGAWEFHRSPLLRLAFPLAQYLDTFLLSVPLVWLPQMLGRTLLFDRYALDVLVDTMVAIGDPNLHRTLVGRAMLRLIPAGTKLAVLHAPSEEVRLRRPDLLLDPLLARRSEAYKTLADDNGICLLDGNAPINVVTAKLREYFGL